MNIYKISLTKDQVPFDAEARVVDFKVIPFPFRPFDQRRSPLAALPDAAADVNHCRRDQPAGCAPLAAPPVPMPPVPMPVPPLAAPPTSNVIKFRDSRTVPQAVVYAAAVNAAAAAFVKRRQMVDAALAYAEHGVPVIPLSPQTRKPIPPRDPDPSGKYPKGIPFTGGVYKATTDRATIEAWWLNSPGALIAVPMGERTGVWTLDADLPVGRHHDDGVAALKKLCAEHGDEWPETRIHASPSRAPHYVFTWNADKPIHCSRGELPKGIDVLGQGGYIIVPPSKRNDGSSYIVDNDAPIAEAPSWLVDLVLKPRAPRDDEPKGESVAAELGVLAEAMKHVANDDLPWDEWTRIGMALFAASNGDGFQLFDEWSQKSSKYDDDKTFERWENFIGSPPTQIGAGTIFYLAKEGGWIAKTIESSPKQAASKGSVVVCAADIIMRPKHWLWRGHLLRGAQELLTGIPGLGKSQVQICFVACVTAGRTWPDGERGMTPGNVIMLTAEDTLDQEVVPRLIAAGADRKRVHILKSIRTDKQTSRQFLLSEDLVELEKVVREIGDVALITIDPITAYMGGKIDSHKTTEVRSQLGPLKDFAERMDVAVSTITHPPKSAGLKAIDQFIGSQAFIAAGRIGHVCIAEMEENDDGGKPKATGRILFANAKNNPHILMPTLAYRINEVVVGQDPDTRDNIAAPFIKWEIEAVNISADQAVAVAAGGKAGAARGEQAKVQQFLTEILANEPVAAGHIEEEASRRGYTRDQLRTARQRLKITTTKNGLDGGWMWSWPM